MNILDYLDSKETKSLIIEHPFVNRTSEFKSAYCFGIATLAFGYKKNLPDIEKSFSALLRNMDVDEKKEKQIISSVYTVFDFKITEVFEKISDKIEQYCFVADLYKIANGSLLSPTYCQDIIDGYMRAFRFSKTEKTFFKDFMACASESETLAQSVMMVKRDQKERILAEAKQAYETFQNGEYSIPYRLLQYMFPEFHREKRIENLVLSAGENIIIDFPAEFFGKIELHNGSSLVIKNTTVIFHTAIKVNGGKICIKDSEIKIESCAEDSFINIEETTLCQISNSEIDCREKTAFLQQEGGNLYLAETIIKNTENKSAIVFNGKDINIETASFLNCKNGAIWNDATGDMYLKKCKFSYCSREHGGAVYSRSIHDTIIEDCYFEHCIAQYLGGAVYFQNRKYGQWVENCKIEECAPKDSCVFNEYNYKLKRE